MLSKLDEKAYQPLETFITLFITLITSYVVVFVFFFYLGLAQAS